MRSRGPCYEVVTAESTPDVLVIRDVGPWDRYQTVTNAVELVVKQLTALEFLHDGRRLFYYDSSGDLDEIVHEGGRFKGFRCVTPAEQRSWAKASQ